MSFVCSIRKFELAEKSLSGKRLKNQTQNRKRQLLKKGFQGQIQLKRTHSTDYTH